MPRRFLSLISFFIFLFIFNTSSFAQENPSTSSGAAIPKEERLEAVVTQVVEEKEVNFEEKKQLYQKLEVLVTKGSIKGKKIVVENGNIPSANALVFKKGDQIIITASSDFENKDFYQITDYIRTTPLYWLFGLFVGLIILVSGKRGVLSIIGMIFSFFIIFSFLLPQISSGKDPIFIAIVSSFFIIPVTFYLSHGFRRQTTAAIIGTVISLIVTGILANIFVYAAKLSGFAQEEANFLETFNPGQINIQGLLLAGIIIGVLGILDDVTISQASIVYELKKTAKNLSVDQLFSKAMNIGKGHIASVVNTLILVYAGASMPLLLLFINNPTPFNEVINYEILAEEIVRTLVASIGLILAVPITTFLSVYFVRKN